MPTTTAQRTAQLATELQKKPVNVAQALQLIAEGVDVATNAAPGAAFPMPLLTCAVISGEADVVKALVEAGADVNQRSKYGALPVFMAAMAKQPLILGYLISRGADLDLQGANGSTPIMDALAQGNGAAARMLMDAGADLTIRNQQGLAATDLVGNLGFSGEQLKTDMRTKLADRFSHPGSQGFSIPSGHGTFNAAAKPSAPLTMPKLRLQPRASGPSGGNSAPNSGP
jgi:ankyrin repeat protein